MNSTQTFVAVNENKLNEIMNITEPIAVTIDQIENELQEIWVDAERVCEISAIMHTLDSHILDAKLELTDFCNAFDLLHSNNDNQLGNSR